MKENERKNNLGEIIAQTEPLPLKRKERRNNLSLAIAQTKHSSVKENKRKNSLSETITQTGPLSVKEIERKINLNVTIAQTKLSSVKEKERKNSLSETITQTGPSSVKGKERINNISIAQTEPLFGKFKESTNTLVAENEVIPSSGDSHVSDISYCTIFSNSDGDQDYVPECSNNAYSSADSNQSHPNVSLRPLQSLKDPLYNTDSDDDSSHMIAANLGLQVVNVKQPKRIRSRDLCFYCNKLVLNFARHIQRHHPNEIDVRKIMSKPRNSREKKELCTSLRKKGNYKLKYIKPMKNTLLPFKVKLCTLCLGYYSHKNLWKHRINCIQKFKRELANANSKLEGMKN